MIAGRARILSATILGLGLLVPICVLPATAATCALSAPATVQVGSPLAILGSGFPVSSSIDVSIGLQGATPDQFAVQSDGAGAFQINLTPEFADVGTTTVLASAGTTCSAQAVFAVTGATASPTPEATAPPGGSGNDASGAPPRTDVAIVVTDKAANVPSIGWALALLTLLIGLAGALVTRRTGGR
jgi:hypothetical protein